MCIYLIVAQAIFCAIMSVLSGFFVSNNAELQSDQNVNNKGEYIFYTGITSHGINGTDSSISYYNPISEAFTTYGVYFILLNTIIPISLVVSMEFIKLV